MKVKVKAKTAKAGAPKRRPSAEVPDPAFKSGGPVLSSPGDRLSSPGEDEEDDEAGNGGDMYEAVKILQKLRGEHETLLGNMREDARRTWAPGEEEDLSDRVELTRVIAHGRVLRRRLEELEARSIFLKREGERLWTRTNAFRGNPFPEAGG